jgi:hypothetical protein
LEGGREWELVKGRGRRQGVEGRERGTGGREREKERERERGGGGREAARQGVQHVTILLGAQAMSEAAGARREAVDAVEEGRRTACELGREIDNLRKALDKQQDAYSSVASLVQVCTLPPSLCCLCTLPISPDFTPSCRLMNSSASYK